MPACRLCPGLEKLADRHGVERIILQGWKQNGGWVWIADVLTDEAEGHGSKPTPDEAMNDAIAEIVR